MLPSERLLEAYTFIETAKRRGEEPGDYLLRAALAAIESPGTVALPKGHD